MPYILVLAATCLLSGLMLFGVMMFRPDLLKGTATAAAPDSLSRAVAPKFIREFAGPTLDELTFTEKSRTDSVAILRDSLGVLTRKLLAEAKKLSDLEKTISQKDSIPARTPGQPAAQTQDASKATNAKSRAKVLEAMPAADAARILAGLTDEETKELLQFIKARQAAKIMAAIQPDRASRLFR